MRKFLLIFYLFSCFIFSQEKNSLKQVLNQLTKRHNIAFSYNENLIQNFKNISYNPKNDLKSVLLQLSVQTMLVFEEIDHNTYIVRKRTNNKMSICGVVLSKKNNEKLPFANVYYQHKNTIANNHGKFKIEDVLIDDIITIKSLGHQPLNIPVKDFNTDCKQIYLTEQINELTEIVIADYLTTGFTKKRMEALF